MKTYNIKGKKLTVDYLNIDKTLYALLEALDEREALSDKEEEKKFSATEELLKMCNKGYVGDEPKQEECDECDGSGFMLDHEGDYNAPCDSDRHKQSTSLKETLVHEFRVNCADQVMATGGLADFDKAIEHIISLIQSHLVKEVKDKSFYGPDLKNMLWEEDIIKIINNITK